MANTNTKWFRYVFILLLIFLLLYIYLLFTYCKADTCSLKPAPKIIIKNVDTTKKTQTMHIMTVSCARPNYRGIRDIQKPLNQSLTMVKSAALFARQRLHIHIFTEDDMAPLFKGKMYIIQ